MRFKRYLVNISTRTMLHLKNLKGLALVPLFILDILIPVLNYLVYKQYGVSDRLYTNILQYSQWLMPLASVWCSLFVLRDYLESDGNELLYANPHGNKFADIFILFLISILNITILFLIYTALIPDMKYEYLKILTICVFYFGLVYGISFLTKSTTMTTLIVVLYTIANVCFEKQSSKIFLFIYFSTERISKKLFISDYCPLLLAGILLTALGVIINVKKSNFVKYI